MRGRSFSVRVLSVLFFLFLFNVCSAAEGKKSVLFLFSLDQGRPIYQLLNSGFISAFYGTNGLNRDGADIFYEYLDLQRIKSPGYQRSLAGFLAEKYSGRRFDLAVVVQKPAMDFLLDEGKGLLPGVPGLYVDLSVIRSSYTLPAGFFSIFTVVDIRQTVLTALKVLPGARRLLIVGGNGRSDRTMAETCVSQLKGLDTGAEIVYLTNHTLQGIIDAVRRQPPGTVGVFLAITEDASGKSYVVRDAARLITEKAPFPFFAVDDAMMGTGLCGGYILSMEQIGFHYGEMAVKRLGGAGPKDLHDAGWSAMRYYFDWRALDRFGISEDRLPAGSVIINREYSPWQAYGIYIIGGLVLILVETVLLGLILANYSMRRRAELKVKENEEKFRTIIEQFPEGFILLDEKGMVTEWNSAMEGLSGIGRDEAAGMPYWEIQYRLMTPDKRTPERKDYIKNLLMKSLVSGQSPLFAKPIYFSLCQNESKTLAAQQIVFPVKTAGGFMIGSIISDITERKNAEKQILELNQTLEQRVNNALAEIRQKDHLLLQQSRQAAMGEMMTNIAHQWRQPLNSIGIIVQHIYLNFKNGALTREFFDQKIETLMSLLEHMSRTIDDFRNFFKPAKEPADFSVAQAVRTAVSVIEAGYNYGNVALEFEFAADRTVKGYSNEYSQVVLNILVNAKDVLMERKVQKPSVRIAVTEESGRSVVTISDNAGGMDEGVLPRVFEPYYTTKEDGTGIGLYMSKMIIEKNMNGRLSVRNTAEGAEFRIEV